MSRGKKVIVGMSGGVDSSVSAALLKKQGFEVRGAFMKLFKGSSEKEVRKIAKKLNISLLVFDFSKDFQSKIIDFFLKDYSRGITPNPCVNCNREIKFGLLLKKIMGLGADYIATGHYARIVFDKKSQKYKLMKGKDKTKDQSYFLWTLSQNHLQRIIFPVGGYTKKDVRRLAEKLSIISVVKKESEDICFVKNSFEDFIKKHICLKEGPIVDRNGKELGRHSGLALYTIGQRKKIKIPSGKPYYVIGMDFKKNTLLVSRDENDLYQKELIAEKVNWVSGEEPDFPISVLAKIRYGHKGARAIVKKQGKKIKVVFSKPQRAITPGQSVVFYKIQEALGGGIITSFQKQ